MSVRLEKAKGDPKTGQSVCHCPYCEREVFATVKAPRSKMSAVGTAVALIVLLIGSMLYLILQNPEQWLRW